MDNIWSILQLEPTKDVPAIKRAYARQARECHPEEDPEGFLRLRQAYQQALDWAETEEEAGAVQDETAYTGIGIGLEPEEDGGEDGEAGWVLAETGPGNGPDLYMEHEANQKFLELYSGKQRRNPKMWMDYFTSPSFLDAARDERFTALLLAEAAEQNQDCPPSREFLTWLSIAYQYTQEEAADESGQRGRQFHMTQGAQFSGIESIFRIALLGPRPKRLAGNELAMFISFFEYNRLTALAETSGWNERAIGEFSHILGRYSTAYLQDRCVKKEWNDVERHPAGLRLLEHFFRRQDLPEELYRILWQKFHLKSALFGRSKVFYNNLRELVMERVPGIETEAGENFLQLNREHDAYRSRVQRNPEREDEEAAAFFANEEFQKALRSRRFIEEQLLAYSFWLSTGSGEGFLKRLLAFYEENPDLPCASRVTEKVRQTLHERVVQRRDQEDRDAPGVAYYERLTLAYRPFFRFWLNTGFYTAKDPETGWPLLEYLNRYLPYQAEWSRRFLTKEDGQIQPRTIAVSFGTIEVIFHRRYMEFRAGGKPVYRPCLSWEHVCGEGGEWFFYLLPLAAAAYGQYEEVRREIGRRLPLTAAPQEDYAVIAGCLAGMVCRIPDEPEGNPLAALPLELFAEDGERLYGAAWYPAEGVLVLFEQSSSGRRELPNGVYERIYGEDEALSLARRLLDEAVSPKNFDLSLLAQMPVRLYAQPVYAPAVVLPPEAESCAQEREEDDGPVFVASGDVAEYLGQFADGKLRRLELEWYSGTLVLASGKSGYACFFFETGYTTWYTMVALPEVYQTVDHRDVKYVPFGMGKLEEYSVFHSAASMMRNLDLVFMQIGRSRPQTRVDGRWLWSSTTNLHDAKQKLITAKQKLAGFPPERCRNYILAKFIISQFPAEVESVAVTGGKTLTEVRSGTYGQVSASLVQFMQKKLARLRLSWEFQTPEGLPYRRHIVLLQDNGRYMMAWLQDDRSSAEFYVADQNAYMDIEGKKYPKDVFGGKTVPAYLIHPDLERIRNCLDLLLDDMSNTDPVTARFAEFAAEKPGGQRPYEVIRGELLEYAEV